MFRIFVIIWLVSVLTFYSFDDDTIRVQTDEPIEIDFVFLSPIPRPVLPFRKSLDVIEPAQFVRSKLTHGSSMRDSEL